MTGFWRNSALKWVKRPVRSERKRLSLINFLFSISMSTYENKEHIFKFHWPVTICKNPIMRCSVVQKPFEISKYLNNSPSSSETKGLYARWLALLSINDLRILWFLKMFSLIRIFKVTFSEILPSRNLLVQSQPWKQQHNVWNLSLTPFWCLYCSLWRNFTNCLGVSIVDFKQVYFCRVEI